MSKVVAPKTLRLLGLIRGKAVTILIDLGNTHNFIQIQVAIKLHLPIISIDSFLMMIGIGDKLTCSSISENIEILIQGVTFMFDFYIL